MVVLSNEMTLLEKQENTAGFRLQRLEIYNWGTFNRRIWCIEPAGGTALLTGANGSGKSTLVDALLTLLVPYQRRSYNLASGSEKARERDERSYILGAWGKQKDLENNKSKAQYLRQHGTHSVLLAFFANPGTGQAVTLAQVLWIEDSVRKLFIVAPRPLTIEEHFRLHGAPADLRKQLKEHGAEVYNEFSAYGRRFRQLMGFRSEKALDLFNQIVSIKEIGGLNDFVREHMLEKTDAQTRIKQLRDNFENLTRAHDAIQMAERQLSILEPLMQDAQRYEEQQSKIDETNRSAELLNVYIASQRKVLAQQVILQARQRLVPVQARDEVLRQELERLHQQQLDLGVAINNDDVGRQLDRLRRDIDALELRRRDLESQASRYDRLATQAGLAVSSDEATFYRTRQRAELQQVEMNQKLAQFQAERDDYVQRARQFQQGCQELESELTSLQQRSSQIPAEDVRIRQRLVEALGLEESDIPFAGELLRVRQSEQRWEPAIERLLHGFGRQLLVAEAYYPQVSAYVNETNLRGRLVYHRIHSTRAPRHDGRMAENALYHKLEVKPDTPFTGWLSAELIDGFDYLCCENLAEFQRANRALTLTGQIRHGQARHEKDDRSPLGDRRQYVLGWNNKEKQLVLAQELQRLQKDYRRAEALIEQVEAQSEAAQKRLNVLQLLLAVESFDKIDWRALARSQDELRRRLRELEQNSQHLAALRQQLDEVKQQYSETQQASNKVIREITDLEQKIESAQGTIVQCERYLDADILTREAAGMERIEQDLRELQKREKELVLSLQSVEDVRERLRQFYQSRANSLLTLLRGLETRIVNGMRDFRQTNPVFEQEMDASLDALGAYRQAHERIRHEDLPRHRRRFKDLLNEKVITDIGSFKAALDTQEDEIRRSIQRLNTSLGSIGYTDSTYIQLVCERSHDVRVRDFRNLLRDCIPDVARTRTTEANEASFQNIRALLKRFEEDARWTSLVTDVRNWLDFSAAELYRETGEQKNYYTDSSGKSGGQKAKLAYTILASAIAYQYGLDQESGRDRTFRFVAVDEAFSKSDEQNARYAMELFRQLDLQLLVVTPLDKIHVVEPYITACHFVTNNEEENDSRVFNLTFAEYRARKQAWQIEEAAHKGGWE
jgi:uncharacterized protein YPO0396